jgi:hypothetical protein
MHRLLVTAAFGLAAASIAATASATGAYERRETDDAAMCARACEDDSICQAWAFSQGDCDLIAATPFDAKADAITGFSSRAPGFVRGVTVAAAIETALEASPEAAQPAPVNDSDPSLDVDYALLGGPDSDALRQRLPN